MIAKKKIYQLGFTLIIYNTNLVKMENILFCLILLKYVGNLKFIKIKISS